MLTETQLRKLLTALPQPAIVVSGQGKIHDANVAASKLLGFELQELLGRGIDSVMPGFTFRRSVDQTSDKVSFSSNDFRKSVFKVSCCPIDWEAEEIYLLLLEPSSEDYEVLQERLRLATDASGIGIFDRVILDEQAPPPFWSDSMRMLLGYPTSADADPEWFFERVHELDKERMAEAVAQASAPTGEGKVEVEVRWHHPDGRDRHLLIRSYTLFRRNKATRSLGVVLDMTSQRELESKFLQAQKMESLGRLAGGVAHDFNNLLSIILGCAELALYDMDESSQGYSEFKEICQASERAAALTSQLLAFGRKQVMKTEVLDLREVLDKLTPMFRRLVESNIEVRVELSSEPLRVKVDRNQILQVFLNLVVNARDAMPHGGVLKIETGDCSGQAVITVSDTGHGMDEATRLRIFEPFFTTKAENRGTGLGLATVFGIVNQSGGSITVTSSVTEGTTFEVRLPLTGAALKIEEAHTPRPARQSSGVILVAEDNDQLRELLEKVLTRAGFKVLSAANPVAAIKLAQGCRDDIDVLLTDIMMPEMNGMELASELRLDRPDLQVIYMSGYTGEMVARAAKLEKGVNFLPKPVKPDRLLEVIQNRLGLKRLLI